MRNLQKNINIIWEAPPPPHLHFALSPIFWKKFSFPTIESIEFPKTESVQFYSCPQGKLKKLPITTTRPFLKIYFFPQQNGEENYGVEKITKIKPTRVLVTSFEEFHHLCNLYIFGFCFVVP